MAQVGAHLIGEPGVGPNGSLLVTEDYDARPFGVYVFTCNFLHGTQPNSRTAFVHSITGMGATWTEIRGLRINASNLVDYHGHVFVAVGALQAGPIVVDIHESVGFPSSIPDAGPASAQEWLYALHRLTNVPTSDLDDLVQNVDSFTFPASPSTATMDEPIGDARNLLFAFTVQSGLAPAPAWPFEDLWRVSDLGAFTASGSVSVAHGGPRTSTWYLLSGGQNGAIILEFGYAAVPWLRQKQRDDV
jgi:hypothetical protein